MFRYSRQTIGFSTLGFSEVLDLVCDLPPELASCHTTEVAGYVIEGHVPAADVLRLLRDKPAGIIGLAVPGMPAGSPGMEVPSGRRDPYQVIAFTADGRGRVFSRHG